MPVIKKKNKNAKYFLYNLSQQLTFQNEILFAQITQPCKGLANKIASDISEGILHAEHKSEFKKFSRKINQIYLKIVTQEFLGSLITDLKNSKWPIQYGGQVNLINFYKPRPPCWIWQYLKNSK